MILKESGAAMSKLHRYNRSADSESSGEYIKHGRFERSGQSKIYQIVIFFLNH